MDTQPINTVGEWIERQPCHQAFWLRHPSHTEQLSTNSEEARQRLVALQALCLCLSTTLLRSTANAGSSPQQWLSMLKRFKQAALCEIQQSDDNDFVNAADTYLSALIVDLYDGFSSISRK